MTVKAGAGWRAPYAASPVSAVVALPGSKSETNRALLLGALADGPARVSRPLVARDTGLMVAALRALGCDIEESADALQLRPGELRGPCAIDCGLAGTVMRFVPPVAALAAGRVSFDGDLRARERPLGPLLGALRALGVSLEPADASRLPFALQAAGRVPGGVVSLDASASSQFVSALLLAGARYDRGIDVRHTGKPLPSLPHIEMTVTMLRTRGVDIDDAEPSRWVVRPGPIAALDTEIEPDLSSAAPFLAAAIATGGSVTITGWPERTAQPGDALRWILERFGAQVTHDPRGLTVQGTGAVEPVDLDLHDVGELTPVLAALAALATGTSYLRRIGHLRGHETDRLAALATELTALGCGVEESVDGLRIAPARLHGGVFHVYADHRLAQAAAVLGLVVPGLDVDDIGATAKTFPGFADAWAAMLA